MAEISQELERLFRDGFSAKDVERLRVKAPSTEERAHIARALDLFLRRAAVTLLPPQRAALWFQVGEAYREGELPAEAAQALKRAVDEDPTHVAAAKTLMALTEELKQWPLHLDALRIRIAQIRRHGHSAQRAALHRRAAQVLRQELGDPQRAFSEILRALRIESEDDALWQEAFHLATLVMGYRDLATLLEELVERTRGGEQEQRHLPRLTEIYRVFLPEPERAEALGERLQTIKGSEGAKTPEAQAAAAKEALLRAMVDLDELRRTEVTLRREQRYKDLCGAYQQHEVALEPDEKEEKAEVALMAALLYAEKLQAPEQAISACERAIGHDAEHSPAHRLLIELCLKTGADARAVEACERWAECSQTHAVEALVSASDLAFHRLQDVARAERALNLAKALAPNDPSVIAAEASVRRVSRRA